MKEFVTQYIQTSSAISVEPGLAALDWHWVDVELIDDASDFCNRVFLKR